MLCLHKICYQIIIISTEMCHADNDGEYCNYNALLRFLITNNMISDLHGFNFKTIIIIEEYLKIPHLKQSGIVHSWV